MNNSDGRITVELDRLPEAVRLGRRGRTVDEVAQEANVSSTTLRTVEAGAPISLASLMKLAAWLNVRVCIDPTVSALPPSADCEEEEEVTEA